MDDWGVLLFQETSIWVHMSDMLGPPQNNETTKQRLELVLFLSAVDAAKLHLGGRGLPNFREKTGDFCVALALAGRSMAWWKVRLWIVDSSFASHSKIHWDMQNQYKKVSAAFSMLPWGSISKWRFPEIGVPPNHPFIDRIFHEINHPFWGTPILGNLQMRCRFNHCQPLVKPVPTTTPARTKAASKLQMNR